MGWQVPIQPVAYTPQIATDTAGRTISTTAFAQLSGSFSVPANDPEPGSVYLLTCWGTYTVNPASSAVPKIRIVLFGTNFPTITFQAPTTGTFTANILIQVWMIVTAIGASGSVNGFVEIDTQEQGTAISAFQAVLINPTVVNTTVASVFEVDGGVTATTGGPSITVSASIYERDGPGAVAQ